MANVEMPDVALGAARQIASPVWYEVDHHDYRS
jgi:hypothetical protein